MTIHSFFVAVDGDLVGQKLENLIISDELEKLVQYNNFVNESVKKIRSFSDHLGGKTYLHGGDNLLVELSDYESFVEQIRANKEKMAISFSIGIGRNAVEAYLALKFAKSTGRGLIMLVEVINGSFNFRQIN